MNKVWLSIRFTSVGVVLSGLRSAITAAFVLFGLLVLLDHNVMAQSDLPDLEAELTNDLGGGNATVDTTFNWTITVRNIGSGDAVFTPNGFDLFILDDALPTGATYGTASVQNATGITGTMNCTIGQTIILSCIAPASSGSVTIAATTGSFQVVIPVTPTTQGTLVNPKSESICKVNSDFVFV